jgi:two-component system alkaline phosphatase synthesis response regulator PhoP
MLPQSATPNILIVDDDREIVRLLRGYFEQERYRVSAAYDGATAMQLLRSEPPNLVMLDIMLPDRDGYEITRAVRANPSLTAVPIIMLTARIGDSDKITGLELGADDYITKPFNPREVVARVRSVLRRAHILTAVPLHAPRQVGELEMDISRRRVTVSGQNVELTPTEFALLRTLLENPDYVFSRAELIARSLGDEYESIERTLDSHIRNLRKKIEPDAANPTYIQTVYGVGYRLRHDD